VDGTHPLLRGRLTPRLTGAGSRRLEGTNIGHENAEGMAYVGVRVEPTVRLGRVGTAIEEVGHMHKSLYDDVKMKIRYMLKCRAISYNTITRIPRVGYMLFR